MDKMSEFLCKLIVALIAISGSVVASAVVLWCAGIEMTSRGPGLAVLVAVAIYASYRCVTSIWLTD